MTEDFFEDISNDVEVWYDTSKYDENDKRPLRIGKNKKVIELFKDELGRKIMKEFSTLRVKTYSYLMDDNSEIKKSKGTKKCVIKIKTMFEYYTGCFLTIKLYQNHNKDLKAIIIMFTQKKLIRLH